MNPHPSPLLDLPAPIPGGTRYAQLAYLDARDEVLGCTYAFLAYRETDSDGTWRVRIRSSQTAGAVFEPEMILRQARSTSGQGGTSFDWGYSFDPSPGDPRDIRFRVHVVDGSPAEIEMSVRLRQADGSAAAVRSIRFPWPA